MLVPERLQSEDSKVPEIERKQHCQHTAGSADNDQGADVPPPAYIAHESPNTAGFSKIPGSPLSQIGVKPTNHLSMIGLGSSIKGTYVIDPRLKVPASLLQPLKPGETEGDRKNLYLHTRNGSIDIDIFLVGREENVKPGEIGKRTTLKVSSNDGSVKVKINSVKTIDPFSLDIFSKDGNVTVLLPRSFTGPLYLKARHYGCVVSNNIHSASTFLGITDNTSRYFVGDFAAASTSEWKGDELKVETRDGRIKVRYVDEPDTHQSKGFFDRIFGA